MIQVGSQYTFSNAIRGYPSGGARALASLGRQSRSSPYSDGPTLPTRNPSLWGARSSEFQTLRKQWLFSLETISLAINRRHIAMLLEADPGSLVQNHLSPESRSQLPPPLVEKNRYGSRRTRWSVVILEFTASYVCQDFQRSRHKKAGRSVLPNVLDSLTSMHHRQGTKRLGYAGSTSLDRKAACHRDDANSQAKEGRLGTITT